MGAENTENPPPKRESADLIIPPTMVRKSSKSKRVSAKEGASKRVGFWGYAALFVLGLFAFAPIVESDLLWSEYDEVSRTAYSSMNHWTEAWTLEHIKRHNPIALSAYFLETRLPLPAPATHRLANLALHLFAAFLLLKVLERLKLRGAYAAAMVFALHPAVLQTLFWPGYRDELVGLICILATLVFGIRHRDGKDFILTLLLTLVSALMHPAALVIPLILALCVFYQNNPSHLTHYNRVLPLFCISLFVGVWSYSGRSLPAAAAEIDSFAKAGQYLYFYLQQSFLPFDSRLFHHFSEGKSYHVGAVDSLLAFVIFIPFYVLIALNFRKQWARALLLGLSSFLLLLLYGILQTGRFIDGSLAKEARALYVALPAAVAIAVCGAAGFLAQIKVFGQTLQRAFFALFLILQLGLTLSASYAVGNTPRMWERMAEQWQNSWQPKAALLASVRASGSDLLSQSEMIRTLEEILEVKPDRHRARIDLARLYVDSGQNTNALREYRRILRDTQPGDDFLKEAADFFDSRNLRWEATNTRERIERSNVPQ